MEKYTCQLCTAKFNTKSKYDIHCKQDCMIIAKFCPMGKIDPLPEKRKKTDQPLDIMENMMQIVKRMNALEDEVASLKSKLYIHKKKKVKYAIKMIHSQHDFNDWVQTLNVTHDIMEKVFQTDLKSGLKSVIHRAIRNTEGQAPMIAFKEKPNEVYCFKGEKWNKMILDDYFYLTNHITRQLSKYYLDWRQDKIFTKEEEEVQDKYFCKICGHDTTEKRIISNIEKWLYSKVQIDCLIDEL